MLPPLQALDRPGLLGDLGRLVAMGEADRAVDRIAANPLAVMSWVATDGIMAGYLDGDAQRIQAHGAVAVLFARWRRERFAAKTTADQLTAACFDRQIEYFAFAFGRLRTSPEAYREAARRGHRAMSRAALLRDAGSLEAAEDSFGQARAAWHEVADPVVEGQVAADRAAILDALDRPDDALGELDLAVDVATATGDLERLGRRRLHRGKMFLMLDRPDLALADYREAQGVFHITGEHAALALALLAEGETALATGDERAALAALETARTMARRLGDGALEADVTRLLETVGP